MKLTNRELGLAIEIDDELVKKIHEAGLAHYPNEYGGILIGEYSDDRQLVSVMETILPKSFKSSPISFERNSDGIKKTLEHFFWQERSWVYVGEWHTHPDGTPVPSFTDVNAFKEIVAYPEVNIDNPVMLIIGLTPELIELAFYAFFNQRLYKYEEL